MEESKMSQNVDMKRVVTGKVRLSYCHLITPRAQEQGGKLKYSVTLLIPKSDVATKQKIDAAIQAAIQEGVAGRWNGARPVQPPIPVHDGDGLKASGEPFTEECKGHWVMTASSEQKPQIVDAFLNEIINATEIYSGMYGRASIRFFAYANSGKKGIGCGLNNVQKLEDGVPLGGRTNANDDFGGVYTAPSYPPANTYPAQQYQQPAAVPTAPQYQPPVAPIYQQPVYQAPEQQQYQQPAPQYTPQPVPQYAPQPVPQYQQPAQQFDPVTGKPITGGIMGL